MNCTSRWTSGWTSRRGIHYGYGAFFPFKKAFKHWDGHLDVHPDVHLDVQFIMVIVLGLSLINFAVSKKTRLGVQAKASAATGPPSLRPPTSKRLVSGAHLPTRWPHPLWEWEQSEDPGMPPLQRLSACVEIQRMECSSFRHPLSPKGPNLEKIQDRLKISISLEIFNLAWNFQSWPPAFPTKNRGLVGGALENFKLAWNFQDLDFFQDLGP